VDSPAGKPARIVGTITSTLPPLSSVATGTVGAVTAGTLVIASNQGGLPHLAVDGFHFLSEAVVGGIGEQAASATPTTAAWSVCFGVGAAGIYWAASRLGGSIDDPPPPTPPR
jgi:hypothetical protein